MDHFMQEMLNIVNMAEEVDDLGDYRQRVVHSTDYRELLDSKEFFIRFRMSKRCFDMVLSQIEARLKHNNERNYPVSPAVQLQIALRFYATGSFQITNGDFFAVSQASVSRIVKKVTNALCELLPYYIYIAIMEEVAVVKRKFHNIGGFPNVIGTIDCTYVQLESLDCADREIHRNRKGTFSINVQTISDANLKIRDIVARWPGSTNHISQ